MKRTKQQKRVILANSAVGPETTDILTNIEQKLVRSANQFSLIEQHTMFFLKAFP